MNIYKEIEETFKLGGRVNLEQYLNQGKIIYSSIIYSSIVSFPQIGDTSTD